MKKKTLFALSFFIVLIFAIIAKGAVDDPGTEADPLVTKSYVDSAIDDIRNYIETKFIKSDSFVVVNLYSGETLVGDMGTEIILRSGVGVVYSVQGGGISDITDGKDLKKGEKILANHLLIIPRDDNRGVYAKTNLVLMVKGSYQIIKK